MGSGGWKIREVKKLLLRRYLLVQVLHGRLPCGLILEQRFKTLGERFPKK